MAKKRAPREAPPPGKYIVARMGHRAKLRGAGRNEMGRKLYRLVYLLSGGREPIIGTQEWTLQDLIDAGVEFREKRPSEAALLRHEEKMLNWYKGLKRL